MWTVIYMAQSKEVIDKLKQILEEHSILFKVRSINKSGEEDSCYEVLVPDTEVSEAHELLIEAQL